MMNQSNGPTGIDSLESIRNEAVGKIIVCEFDPGFTDATLNALVGAVSARLVSPFDKAITYAPGESERFDYPAKLRGQQLLRFCHNQTLAPHSRRVEKVYEKSLIKECVADSDLSWANQIPVFSGITRIPEGGVSIDLAFKERDGVFCMYELKTGATNDPLYGLIELLTYALGYLIIRRIVTLVPAAESAIRKRSNGMLDAQKIRWILLGTPNFYRRKLRGGAVVDVTQLESVCVAVEKVMTQTVKRFGLGPVEMTVEVQQLAADLPTIAVGQQQAWLTHIKADSTLRQGVLRAQRILPR